MATKQPLWLRAVHRLERVVGGPVEAAVRSDTYFDVVAHTNRAMKRVGRTVEGVSRGALHVFNLPAASDVRRVREQLARMDRRLNQITKELADLEPGNDDTRQGRPA